jgi:N-hydroxyarylamine O-acetyltransferase
MTSLEITPFLERIGYQGSAEVSLETLKGLQRAFLLSVPFENLDIHFDEKPALSFTAFYEKIVEDRRGGISYECNGLFLAMLRAMGFDVQLLSARICFGNELTDEFEHMLILVSLSCEAGNQEYLVDVGLGQSCPQPMLIGSTDEYQSENCSYRLGTHQDQPALFYKSTKSDWQPRYVFSMQGRALVDFAPMYRFHQISEQSPFTQGQLVTLMTETGRVTLNGMTLSIVDGDKREQRELASEAQYLECLKTHFAIEFEA